jgi:hypothetical protein
MNRADPHTRPAVRPPGWPTSGGVSDKVQSLKLVRDQHGVDALQKFLWGALIASFPFTALEIWPSRLKQFGEPAVLIAALLGVLVLGDAVLRPEKIFIPKGRSAWFLLLFMAIVGASFFISHPINPYMWPGHNPWTKSAKQITQWLTDGWVAYLTLRFVRTWKDFRFALKCQFIGLILMAGSGFLELAALHWPAGVAHSLYHLLHNGGMEDAGRLDLLAYEPSIAGDYLMSVIPLLICGAYYWKSRQWTVLWSAVALLLFCGTFSLGSFGALFAAALLVSVVYARRGSKGMLVGLVLLLIVLIASVVTSSKGEQFLGNRVGEILENGLGPSIPDFSTRQRLASAEAAFNIFLEHPVLGVGIGKSPFYIYSTYPVWALNQGDLSAGFTDPDQVLPTTFNLFLQMLAETGLVGGAVFIMLLLSMLADCYSAMNTANERWKKAVFAGILFALVAQIIHYNAMSWTGLRYWFFIWGLAICAPRLLKQKDLEIRRSRIAAGKASPFLREPHPVKVLS